MIFLIAKRWVKIGYAPSVFIPTVTESLPIRTSHPSGSRRWELPLMGEIPGPWLLVSPRKTSVPCHGQVLPFAFVVPPGRDGRCLSVANRRLPLRSASQIDGSSRVGGPTHCWFHDRGASVEILYSTMMMRDAAAINQNRWLLANTGTSSPPQPITYPFM